MRGTYTELYVHLIWATWDRLPLITDETEPHIYDCFEATCRALGAHLRAVGGIQDHVHLIIGMTPTLCVADLVKNLKGASSHLMTHEIDPDGFFKWQGGYGAFTVSPSKLPNACAYALNQKDHHRLGHLIAAFELPAQAPHT